MCERFSVFQCIDSYTPLCYVLNPEEQKVLNITCKFFYCRCFVKSQCKCLQKKKAWISNKIMEIKTKIWTARRNAMLVAYKYKNGAYFHSLKWLALFL